MFAQLFNHSEVGEPLILRDGWLEMGLFRVEKLLKQEDGVGLPCNLSVGVEDGVRVRRTIKGWLWLFDTNQNIFLQSNISYKHW